MISSCPIPFFFCFFFFFIFKLIKCFFFGIIIKKKQIKKIIRKFVILSKKKKKKKRLHCCSHPSTDLLLRISSSIITRSWGVPYSTHFSTTLLANLCWLSCRTWPLILLTTTDLSRRLPCSN